MMYNQLVPQGTLEIVGEGDYDGRRQVLSYAALQHGWTIPIPMGGVLTYQGIGQGTGHPLRPGESGLCAGLQTCAAVCSFYRQALNLVGAAVYHAATGIIP